MSTNPFDRWGIDPLAGPEAITARFRELIEEADEATRDALRATWEELVTHPRTRLGLALGAYPGPPAEEIVAPLVRRAGAGPTREPALGPGDVALAPSVREALCPGGKPDHGDPGVEGEEPRALPAFNRDPLLREER